MTQTRQNPERPKPIKKGYKGHAHKGFFLPMNPKKYMGDHRRIIYRSSWEKVFMQYCDERPHVIEWGSEELKIPYWSNADNKNRRYFTDFIMTVANPTTGEIIRYVIEIKPNKERHKPKKTSKKSEKTYVQELYTYQVNQDKWNTANIYCEERGWKFLVMDEYDLGIKERPGKKTSRRNPKRPPPIKRKR